MEKIIKHIILEFLNETKKAHISNDIVEKCIKRYPKCNPASMQSIISSLGRDNFLTKSESGVALYRINNTGIEELKRLDDIYVESCDFGCYVQNPSKFYDDMSESEIFNRILFFVRSEDRWVSAKEVSTSMNLPEHYTRRIARKLILLEKNGLIIKHRRNNIFLYSFKEHKSYFTPSNNKVVEETPLNKLVEELLDFGVNRELIDETCSKALDVLLEEHLTTKRSSEMDYLKENGFLFLEDFNNMKTELERLREEVKNIER